MSMGMWEQYSLEAVSLGYLCDFSMDDLDLNAKLIARNKGRLEVKKLLWFIPNVNYAFYGGLHTIFRFASYLNEKHNVENTFAILGDGDPDKLKSAMGEAFPALADQTVLYFRSVDWVTRLPPSDACISTLWITAYFALKYNQTRRKFYFLQDFEPLFYPAGSTYAQAEASYRFGFYGLANTISLKKVYEEDYGGSAEFFTPAVDQHVFFPSSTRIYEKSQYRIFFYGRPGHPRNAFELGTLALRRLKEKYGDRVEILTAGSVWDPAEFGLERVITNLGLLPYKRTGDLYRECDLGLVMMLTRHPSYLPLELMACGCTVVTNYNRFTSWLLKDGENCLLSNTSVSSIAEVISKAIDEPDLRKKINDNAGQLILQNHSSWDSQIEKIYSYMQAEK